MSVLGFEVKISNVFDADTVEVKVKTKQISKGKIKKFFNFFTITPLSSTLKYRNKKLLCCKLTNKKIMGYISMGITSLFLDTK